MVELKLSTKNDYAKAVCVFLAEGLRTRQLSLHRGAEIAQKVVRNINLLDTEYDFLKLIKELSKDFEELVKLEDRVFLHIKSDERKIMEHLVKEFVVEMLTSDTSNALSIMEEAVGNEATMEALCKKFPQFNEFIQKKDTKPFDAQNIHFKRL